MKKWNWNIDDKQNSFSSMTSTTYLRHHSLQKTINFYCLLLLFHQNSDRSSFSLGVEGKIVISSSLSPSLTGTYVRGVEHNHESSFAQAGEKNTKLWLFSKDNGIEGYRWYIGDDINSSFVLAFYDSFSSDPCRNDFIIKQETTSVNDNSWMVTINNVWHPDPLFDLRCEGFDLGGVDACDDGSNGDYNYRSNTAVPCVNLTGGIEMPLVMLGTAHISASHGAGAANPEVIEQPPAIEHALDIGYQGLDLGSEVHPAYANEAYVGNILSTRPGRRNSIFIETKLSPSEHGFDATLRAFQRSLRLLRTDTIDLFLIHHPQCLMVDRCEGDWVDSWRAMERLLGLGAVRAIGVSNFDAQLLNHLLSIAKAPVALVQNRADPLAPEDSQLLDLCQTHSIQYQAFSVLGRQWVVGPWAKYWDAMRSKSSNGGGHPILDHPHVAVIANRLTMEMRAKNNAHNATSYVEENLIESQISTAQVILRWAIEKGWSVVPKTANHERLETNRHLFHFNLTESDISTIDHLPAPEHDGRQSSGEL